MTRDESWQQFCYDYLETGWFDFEDRPKTAHAMKTLWERIPQDTLDTLDTLPSITVFAPSPDKSGEVFPFFGPARPADDGHEECFIYLSPNLERKKQSEVDDIVAHEFAHVALGCYRREYKDHSAILEQARACKSQADVPGEKAADELIVRWGYCPAYKRPQAR